MQVTTGVLHIRENFTEEETEGVSLVLRHRNYELVSSSDITGQDLGKELRNGAPREAERALILTVMARL
jgi:hypothetical protein